MSNPHKLNTIALIARNIKGKTGASQYIMQLARFLGEKGHTVTLIASKFSLEPVNLPHIQHKKILDIRLGSYCKRRYFAFRADFYSKRNHFDIIHGHGDSLNQDILSLHNLVHKTHEIMHGTSLPHSSGVGRIHNRQLSEKRFKIVIAHSHLMQVDLEKRFRIPKEQIRVVYPGHDPQRFNTFDRDAVRKKILSQWNIPPQSFIIGFLTSGDFKKRNLMGLFQAIAHIPEPERKNIRCFVTGHDSHIETYRNKAVSMGIGDLIIYTGAQDKPEDYYKTFDVYVHPAYFEEFGLSVLEAMACGTPVITTSTTGASELFEGDSQSLIVNAPENIEQLSSYLLYLKRNNIQRIMIGRSMPKLAQNRTWHMTMKTIYSLYSMIKKLPA
ncbi:MAG: glycosyltransferase [Elusimicrobia bacterium]|nr:glycosyltransferase [Elusimicrobiota bacterium]MBD3412290.1 glycosyltransferase [Elusimicrobiota bacterium]